MTEKAPAGRITRRQALAITGAAVLIVYLIWNIAFLAFLAYPLRLFVTYVHEAGHSLMALASGGEVVEFQVYSDGSGIATTRGGVRELILPAGYIGAALFGAALFYLVNRTRASRTLSIIVGVGLIVFSLLYAATSDGFPLALVIGIIGGAALIALGWKAPLAATTLVLNVLAIMTALNAVLDIVTLTRYSDIAMPTGDGEAVIRNDAAAFAEEIGFLPPSFWALLWAGISILIVGAAVYYALLRPMLRDTSAAVSQHADGLSSLTPRFRRRKDDDSPDV
jgi:hypothetical protein